MEDGIDALRTENDELRGRVAFLERELQVLQERLRSAAAVEAIFLALPDLHFRVLPDSTVVDYKANRTSDLYVPPEVFLNKRMVDLLPPDVGAAIQRALDAIAATWSGVQAVEYALPMDGSEEWYEARMVPLEGREIAIFVRKVTEQRHDREALRRLNAELEDRVSERTAALELANQRIIETQRAALRALSTPLVPIARHVVAVPLIGTIDEERAQQLIETLLEGVQSHHATVVLLDVTGVSGVDAPIADAIMRAARAVGLLGAQLVMTGIGPEVARTMVTVGADLSGIVTQGSLEQGIAYAMRRAR
ncbi:MAG: PAS domain-containing protein [Polyangiaceae bacterium]|nr:PAS domain-containing protein [Polyangiaceae bacterium]